MNKWKMGERAPKKRATPDGQEEKKAMRRQNSNRLWKALIDRDASAACACWWATLSGRKKHIMAEVARMADLS